MVPISNTQNISGNGQGIINNGPIINVDWSPTIRIRISEKTPSILWQSNIRAENISRIWDIGSKVAVQLDIGNLTRFSPILDAFGRACMHSGDLKLYVPRSEDFKYYPECCCDYCCGRNIAFKSMIHPIGSDNFDYLTCGVSEEISILSLAEKLNLSFDTWVLKRLEEDMEKALHDQATMQILHLSISADLATAMYKIWSSWKLSLENDVLLLRRFLKVMLTTAEYCKLSSALVRVGPQTYEECIRDSVVFALAIEAALSLKCFPIRSNANYQNLKVNNNSGQLFGMKQVRNIELNQNQELRQSAPMLAWFTDYVLLSNYTGNWDRLRSQRRMDQSETTLLTASFDSTPCQQCVFFNRTAEFDEQLALGIEPVKTYLLEFLTDQREN